MVAASAFLVLATGLAIGKDDRNEREFSYAVGLWGDLPYSDVQATNYFQLTGPACDVHPRRQRLDRL
jgi:hypothetical protein